MNSLSSNQADRQFLIVFAKEPGIGKVKTRLSGYLSNRQCLNLYKSFLKDTIELADKIKCKNKILAYDSKKSPNYLKRIAPNLIFYKQKGRNLGLRMHNILKSVIKDNSSKAVIIGSDSPTLPARYIENAFRELDKKDVVLGPADDGGYYLIGVKKTSFAVFQGIKWGSNGVLKSTIDNLKGLKKSAGILDRWYDVDNSGALKRLREDLEKEKDLSVARWTRGFLKI